MKQGAFQGMHKTKLEFGGSMLNENTNPKTKRPLSSNLPIHLVLRSVRSWMRAPKHFANVNEIVARVAKRHGVRVYEYANVGNHLHLLIKISRRPRWAAFIRELTGRLATQEGGSGVWLRRPFTRVVSGWQRAYRSCRDYIRLNTYEADFNLSAEDREILRRLHRIWRMKSRSTA